MYAVGATTNGIASVKTMKTVEGIPDPPVTEPEVGNGNVVLALPAGYDSSAKIYIDGVEAASTAWQNDESRRLVAISSIAQPGTTAKTAAAYQYNASGIPTGMYVWRLSYNGSCYTATAIPEFENLFSYHGFSVRYMGNTGFAVHLWHRYVEKNTFDQCFRIGRVSDHGDGNADHAAGSSCR